VQAFPQGHFHVKSRWRARNTGSPFDHLARKTISRIVAIVPVAAKTVLVEQRAIARADGAVDARVDRQRRVTATGN
jgi:hypothetical protein